MKQWGRGEEYPRQHSESGDGVNVVLNTACEPSGSSWRKNPMVAITRHAGALAMILWLGLGVARAEKPASIDVTRWVSDDAVIFVEATRPSDLLDRLMDARVQKPLLNVPSIKKVVEGEHFRKLQEVAELVSGKLGTTW